MDRIIREEARLIILRALNEQPDGRLNSALLQRVLETYGIAKSRDWVHVEIGWLRDVAAVTIVDAGSVRVAAITERGHDHVERRTIVEGIKRPSAEA